MSSNIRIRKLTKNQGMKRVYKKSDRASACNEVLR